MTNFAFSKIESLNSNISKNNASVELKACSPILIETVAAAIPGDRNISAELLCFWRGIFQMADKLETDDVKISSINLLVPDKVVRQLRFDDFSNDVSNRANQLGKAFENIGSEQQHNFCVCFDNSGGIAKAIAISNTHRTFLSENKHSQNIRRQLPPHVREADQTFSYLAHHFITYAETGLGYDARRSSETRIIAIPPTERPFLEMISDALSSGVFTPQLAGTVFIALFSDFSKKKPVYRD